MSLVHFKLFICCRSCSRFCWSSSMHWSQAIFSAQILSLISSWWSSWFSSMLLSCWRLANLSFACSLDLLTKTLLASALHWVHRKATQWCLDIAYIGLWFSLVLWAFLYVGFTQTQYVDPSILCCIEKNLFPDKEEEAPRDGAGSQH